MAKPTKHALAISLILGFIALISGFIAFKFNSSLYLLLGILPMVAYEVYRVEGESTKWASLGLLGTILGEIALIWFNISFDLAKFLGTSHKVISGYDVPLTDIKIFGPILMALFSTILFKNTRGRYTKLLAVFIFLAAISIVYLLSPDSFAQIIKTVTREVLNAL